MTSCRKLACIGLVVASVALAGCVIRPLRGPQDIPVLPPAPVTDRSVEERILALDPENVTAADVRDTLAKGPTPRIMLIHGGIYPVHLSMVSFGRFLVGMGYPEAKIRDPGDGTWSHSPYEDAERLAGILAWYYERDGMRPMMIGHSQGGMQAVKVLHVLNGGYAPEVPVWNPLTDFPESRTAIVDPADRAAVPVVGLRISYVSAVGAGRRGASCSPTSGRWSASCARFPTRSRSSPATRSTSTSGHGRSRAPTRRASSRTAAREGAQRDAAGVVQPRAAARHGRPGRRHGDPGLDRHLSAGARSAPAANAGDNVLWAADVWYSVKKHWRLEAQRLIRARRAGNAPAVVGKLE